MFDVYSGFYTYSIEYVWSLFLTSFVFGRTKAEPAIYYMPAKPLSDDPAIVEQTKEKVGSSLCKLSSFMH
jgi:hypothetical protein